MSTPSKVVDSAHTALSVAKTGDVVMVGGFGGAGFPYALRSALADTKVAGLTMVCNNSDFGDLASQHSIDRLICSFPYGETAGPVLEQIESGEIELLLTPQGTLAEQIRAAGAGIGGVLTQAGLDADLGRDWEIVIGPDGKRYFLVPPLHADVALIHADVADRLGNLYMRKAARNFNPLMAMAAKVTIVEAKRIVEPGELDPEHIHVPSIFVNSIVPLPEKSA